MQQRIPLSPPSVAATDNHHRGCCNLLLLLLLLLLQPAAAGHMFATQEQKRKVQEDLAAHMAAHREQIKAAKARVSRDELARMGAQFEMRALQSPAAPSAAGQVRHTLGHK